jgi:hypothetical protein
MTFCPEILTIPWMIKIKWNSYPALKGRHHQVRGKALHTNVKISSKAVETTISKIKNSCPFKIQNKNILWDNHW